MKIEDDIAYTLVEASKFLNMTLHDLRECIKEHRISVKNTELSQRIVGKEINRFLEELNKIIK